MGASATSVLIVNYNAGNHLADAVRSALRAEGVNEVWVADNGSSDRSMAQLGRSFPGEARLHLLENGANLGFAAANNRLLERASGPLFLLLNPDCVVEEGSVRQLAAALEADPEAGIAGGQLLNPDGTEQEGGRRNLPTLGRVIARAMGMERLRRTEGRLSLAHQPLPAGPVPVGAVSGAFLMIRQQALQAIGPLDPGYFMHWEDLDWCARCALAGKRVLFVPAARAWHTKGVSSRSRPFRTQWHLHRGILRYFRKFGGRGPVASVGQVVLWALVAGRLLGVSLAHLGRLGYARWGGRASL